MGTLTIGKVAKASGVNVETIRYYESLRLLEKPAKPSRGYRVYPQEAVQRVTFIKRTQQLGFTLDEIARLLSLEEGETCARAKAIAHDKLALIAERVADLNRLQEALNELLTRCEAGRGKIRCPIVAGLTGQECATCS